MLNPQSFYSVPRASASEIAPFPLNFTAERLNMNDKPLPIDSKTDWQRLDRMTDADIDLSDCPEITPEMFAGSIVRKSVDNRVEVTLKVDRDVLEWFHAQGDRGKLQMALALKIYAEANQAYLNDRETA
jgi:uncharacterized protein (DUF4415 family)